MFKLNKKVKAVASMATAIFIVYAVPAIIIISYVVVFSNHHH